MYATQEDSEVSDTVFVSRLRLGSVKESHYGEFLCRATNSLGAGTVHRVQLLRWYYVINRWELKCFYIFQKAEARHPVPCVSSEGVC